MAVSYSNRATSRKDALTTGARLKENLRFTMVAIKSGYIAQKDGIAIECSLRSVGISVQQLVVAHGCSDDVTGCSVRCW
jgi:hypothetical protein